MRFAELAVERRPNSEASGNTRSDAGTHISRDLISSVIDRWRSASMSNKVGIEDEFEVAAAVDAPALQPASAPAAPQPGNLRSGLLKKPLEGSSPYPIPNSPVGHPPRYK
jgi:hypothetical protein